MTDVKDMKDKIDMDRVDLILRNGTVALLNNTQHGLTKATLKTSPGDCDYRFVATDVAVRGGKIVGIGDVSGVEAKEILDLKGLHVFPGVIDSQVHFRDPGLTHKEDLETGTKAALLGGVTSIFEMPNTSPSTTTAELFQQKISRAEKLAHCHYAFFIGASNENIDQLASLESLRHCSGIKIFMGSSTGSLLIHDETLLEQIFRKARRRVILHAEDEMMLKERKSIAESSKNVADHPNWRSAETALMATKKAIALAEKTGCKIHILHISSKDEAEYISQKKLSLGSQITCEILPQYLTLWGPDCYDRLGTLAQQNPPIRDRSHYEGLWKAMDAGVFDVIGSDHAPHTLEEKQRPYPTSPSGVPGVQTLVPLMLDHVAAGRMSLSQFLKLVCENPIHVFGIKNKGRIQIGFDADFTIVDLKAERTIKNSWIASKVGWTPYDGMRVRGWPIMTVLKGIVAMREDQILHPNGGDGVDFE